jgi:hypothetical protein
LNNPINIKSCRFNTIFIDATEADWTFFIGWFSSMEQKRFHSSTKSMFQRLGADFRIAQKEMTGLASARPASGPAGQATILTGMSIAFMRSSAGFAIFTFSTPFSKLASIFLASGVNGRGSTRRNVP